MIYASRHLNRLWRGRLAISLLGLAGRHAQAQSPLGVSFSTQKQFRVFFFLPGTAHEHTCTYQRIIYVMETLLLPSQHQATPPQYYELCGTVPIYAVHVHVWGMLDE